MFSHSGFGKGSSHACGVAVALHRHCYAEQRIVRVADGKNRLLQGRVLMVRYKRRRQDLAIASLYYLARGKGRGAVAEQKSIASELTTCLHDQLSSLPARCLPLIGTDLNFTCGMDGGGTPVSGHYSADVEGPSFRTVKPILQAHDLVSASAYFDVGATYNGISSQVVKRINCLACPR
eukprot:6480599-Pyramimonas_sp.AAC.1